MSKQTETRLLPIHSCKECIYLGKEINASPKRYVTFCAITDQYSVIKTDTKETPDHYKFPDFCELSKGE